MSRILLLVLSLIIPGEIHSTKAENCNTPVLVKMERKVIEIMKSGDNSNLFVKPENDFYGVCLTSHASSNYTACFKADECFPNNGKLQELYPWMSTGESSVTFGIWSSTCRESCVINFNSHPGESTNFSVEAVGPSGWMDRKSQLPEHCEFEPKNESIIITRQCEKPLILKIDTQSNDENIEIITISPTFNSTVSQAESQTIPAHLLITIITPLTVGVVVVILVAVVCGRKLYRTPRK